jgi:hypothetical protein
MLQTLNEVSESKSAATPQHTGDKTWDSLLNMEKLQTKSIFTWSGLSDFLIAKKDMHPLKKIFKKQ